MHMLGGILGGAVGGLLGAAIWVAVSFWGRYELGWIAWGIGGLAGMGVYLGGRRQGGLTAGGTAVALAVASVLLGKWGAARADVEVYLHGDEQPISAIAGVVMAEREEAGAPTAGPRARDTQDEHGYPASIWADAEGRWAALTPKQQDELRALPPLANPHFIQSHLADEIVDEHEQRGEEVHWPPGMDIESAWRQAHYPAEIWAEAGSRWEAMTQEQRDQYAAQLQAMLLAEKVQWEQFMTSKLVADAFKASFAPYDLLWFGLAIVTSWRLGAACPRRAAAQEPAAQDPSPST